MRLKYRHKLTHEMKTPPRWSPIRKCAQQLAEKRNCLLADFTKTYYTLAAGVAASNLPVLQAGRLVAFEVRFEPAEE